MKKLYLTIAIIAASISVNAQKTTPKDRFYIDAAVGGEANLSSPSSNSMSGFLLGEKSRSTSFMLRYQQFFSKNWGAFASVTFHKVEPNNYNDLPARVLPDFNKYYMMNYTDDVEDKRDSQTFLVGGQYRYDTKLFSIRPYLGVGVSTFQTDRFAFDLKGIGNNQVYHSQLSMTSDAKVGFCISPGINLVVKVSDSIHLFADANYIQHFGLHEARHTVTDLYNGRHITNESDKSSLPGLFSYKVGISLPIWFYKRR